MQIATRKLVSPKSAESFNSVVALFCAFMAHNEELWEQEDQEEAKIFFPSTYKVSVFFAFRAAMPRSYRIELEPGYLLQGHC